MNSNNRVLCLPYHNTGGHFIDWSINFVAGLAVGQHEINANKNWHAHSTYTARGSGELQQKLAIGHSTLRTIYYAPAPPSRHTKKLFGVPMEIATPEQILAAERYTMDDYRFGIQICQEHDLVPAFFDYTREDRSSIYYNDRCPMDWNGNHITKQQLVDLYHSAFFPQSLDKFTKDVWDQRELCALTYRFPDVLMPPVDTLLDQSKPHLYYNTDDVWNGFDRCLPEICAAWNLDIVPERWQSWQATYQQWRTVHDPYFARHLSRIVDAIVNNKYLSLQRFCMNFYMEVLIQHELIFKHNLNLKTWELEQFPDNTQDLHKLLEPNFHNW